VRPRVVGCESGCGVAKDKLQSCEYIPASDWVSILVFVPIISLFWLNLPPKIKEIWQSSLSCSVHVFTAFASILLLCCPPLQSPLRSSLTSSAHLPPSAFPRHSNKRPVLSSFPSYFLIYLLFCKSLCNAVQALLRNRSPVLSQATSSVLDSHSQIRALIRCRRTSMSSSSSGIPEGEGEAAPGGTRTNATLFPISVP
jgi:hypothetical protein